MNYDLIKFLLYFLLLSPLLFSCNVTKHLAENESLLTRNKVTVQGHSFPTSVVVQDYVVQHPNTKWFSLLRVPLGLYSMSGKDSTKVINKWLRRWGEKPVVLDSSLVHASSNKLQSLAFSHGYLDANVSSKITVNDRKAHVDYTLNTGEPYIIRNVFYNIEDSLIRSLLFQRNILPSSELVTSKGFSIIKLSDERKRITSFLNNNGYRYFNKEMITIEADTNHTSKLVDVTLNIHKFRGKAHPQFRIGEVIYTTPEGKIPQIRQQMLDCNTLLRSGSLYNEQDVLQTYSRFSRSRYISRTDISFQENSPNVLDATISISNRKKHSITVQPEGTNTAGDFGAALLVTYDNLNVFHGLETFSLTARVAYEAISGLEGYSDNNYEEYGVEAKLSIPMLVMPGLSRDYRRKRVNTTDFLISYNLQNRPEFHRRVLRGAWRYNWNSSSGKLSHRLDAVDLNYVSMPWVSSTFQSLYLTSQNAQSAVLRYSYEDLFIMRAGYSMAYSDNRHSVKFSFETAGNLLRLLATTCGFRRGEHGKYEVAGITFAQYAKLDVSYTRLLRFDTHNSLALHGRIGVVLPYTNSNIAPYEKRYFSGGANGVRGWNIRELGPGRFKSKDGRADFVNQSGDFLMDFSAELRSDLFWKLQGALFVDAGNIWTLRAYDEQPGGQLTLEHFLNDIAVAYGIGLRLNFGYFIMRLDLGMKAINPVYNNSKEHFPIIHPNFRRDKALHFAVGLPF